MPISGRIPKYIAIFFIDAPEVNLLAPVMVLLNTSENIGLMTTYH
jgi:heterodisulfide reductase subunit A-like polyferredoxin